MHVGRLCRRPLAFMLGVALTALVLIVTPEASGQGNFGWGTPEQLDTTTPGFTSRPKVAMDAQGNAIAVWEHNFAGGVRNAWANRFVPGVGWGTAELIESDDSGSVSRPHIGMDDAGNAIAVWRQTNATATVMWANHFVPGTGWGSPEPIGPDTSFSPTPGPVAMDPGGNATAVWRQFNGTTTSIYANRFDVIAGWGSAEVIDAGVGTALFPDVAMDSSGNAIAVWDQGTAVQSIFANRFAAGTGWGTPELLETDDTTVAQLARVAVNSGGDAMAVWRQSTNILSNRFVLGTGWETTVAINATMGGGRPAVSMDDQGNAIAAWCQLDGTFVNSVFAARFAPGVGWGTPERIEPYSADACDDGTPIAMDDAGNAIVVWQQGDGIVANRYVVGAGWSGAEQIDQFGAGSPFSPQIAVDPAGNAVAVWESFDVTQGDIMANRFRVDDVPPILTITSPAVTLTNDPIVTIAGLTEPGASVTINGDPVSVDTGGNFALTLLLADGNHAVVVVATDIEGNANQVLVSITVDTVAPLLVLSSPAVDITDNPQVTVAGDTEPGASVTVGGVVVAVDASGAFSHNVTLADGSHSLPVVATDPAGNTRTLTVNVTVDTVAPALLLTSPTEGATTETASVTVAGATEPGASLRVNGLGVPVALNGTFSVDLALSEGSNTIAAIATDAAGNSATVTVNVTYTNPVPGLESDLAQTKNDLAQTQQSLQDTQQALQETQQSLQEAQQSLLDTQQNLTTVESGVANLGTLVTVLFGLVGAFAVVTAVVAFLLWSGRRRARPKP